MCRVSAQGRLAHRLCDLRGLREASTSEIVEPAFNKPARLLGAVKGLELVYPERPDQCCGSGGTFSVIKEPVSAMMG